MRSVACSIESLFGVTIESLWVGFLLTNLDYYNSIFFATLEVDHEPRGVDIWFLRVNLGPLTVDVGPYKSSIWDLFFYGEVILNHIGE